MIPALDDSSWRRFLARWLGGALVLISIAAVRSDGYHHPDEYFQTLEFAGAKLGRTPIEALPWEYRARIRPWLQPALYFVGARAWQAMGVQDPFVWSGSYRLFSGVLSWLALAALALVVPRWFPGEEARRLAVGALCVAWFVPYLAVRTSSECLASSCLTLGFALLVHGPAARGREFGPRVLAAIGALFGLAFEFRFAVAVAIVAILFWAVVVARMPARRLGWIVAGAVFVVAASTLVDRWGYEEWVLPPYEYFRVNLVKGEAAARFGSLPWYGYLYLAASGPTGPLVLILMASAACGWVRRPGHPLTWAGAPFFAVHSLIGHKEMRFLFPIASFALVSAIVAFAPLGDDWDRRILKIWGARRHPAAGVLLAFNVIALAVFTLAPTRLEIEFQRFVYHHDPTHFEGFVLSPYSPWESDELEMHFYRPRTMHLHEVTALSEVEALDLPRFMLVTGSFDFDGPPPSRYSCVALYRSLPFWVGSLLGEHAASVPAWNLYRCLAPGGAAAP